MSDDDFESLPPNATAAAVPPPPARRPLGPATSQQPAASQAKEVSSNGIEEPAAGRYHQARRRAVPRGPQPRWHPRRAPRRGAQQLKGSVLAARDRPWSRASCNQECGHRSNSHQCATCSRRRRRRRRRPPTTTTPRGGRRRRRRRGPATADCENNRGGDRGTHARTDTRARAQTPTTRALTRARCTAQAERRCYPSPPHTVAPLTTVGLEAATEAMLNQMFSGGCDEVPFEALFARLAAEDARVRGSCGGAGGRRGSTGGDASGRLPQAATH